MILAKVNLILFALFVLSNSNFLRGQVVKDKIFSDVPGLLPEKTVSLEDNEELIRGCNARFSRALSPINIHWSEPLITVNEEFGPVLRVDFMKMENDNGDLIGRAVCWRQKNGKFGLSVAVKQSIPPLR